MAFLRAVVRWAYYVGGSVTLVMFVFYLLTVVPLNHMFGENVKVNDAYEARVTNNPKNQFEMFRNNLDIATDNLNAAETGLRLVLQRRYPSEAVQQHLRAAVKGEAEANRLTPTTPEQEAKTGNVQAQVTIVKSLSRKARAIYGL